jgi:hypothetical protein
MGAMQQQNKAPQQQQPQPSQQVPTQAPTASRPPIQPVTAYTQQSPPQQRPTSNAPITGQGGWAPTQQTGVRTNISGTQQIPEGLPSFVKILPAALQNQTGVMILVAIAVLLFMAVIYFVISILA